MGGLVGSARYSGVIGADAGAIDWAELMPGPMVCQASAPMPPADRDPIRDPEVARAFLAMLAETFGQGPAGAQVDSPLVASARGFDPTDVRAPVRMWHGDADENVPIEMARHLAERVPGAQLTILPGEGHLSVVLRQLDAGVAASGLARANHTGGRVDPVS